MPNTTESIDFTSYCKDESQYRGTAQSIFFPESEEEAVRVVQTLKKENTPLTFQGGRTGFLGGAVPNGGAIVNFSKLTEILPPQIEDGQCVLTAACGATLADVEAAAEKIGYTLPVHPTENTATLGGMFATNAAGPEALYYGRFSEYVEAADFLTPDGTLYTLQKGKESDFPKVETLSSSLLPYLESKNDTPLSFLCGKEGYLGAPLRLKLRLLPLPKELWGVVFFFEDVKMAAKFADFLKTQQKSLTDAHLVAAEFYNAEALSLLRTHAKHPLLKALPPLPQGATAALYVELEGETEDGVGAALEELLIEFETIGGKEELTWAESGRAATAPFRAMRHAVPALLNETPDLYTASGFRPESDCVFCEKMPSVLLEIYTKLAQRYKLSPALYGSILDGQLHAATTQPIEEKSALAFVEALYQEAIKSGGRLFSRYGIGKKSKTLLKAFSLAEALQQAEALRRLFDQNLRMNP